MNTAEQNYILLQDIDSNREFMMLAYRQNPAMLERAEARVRQWFSMSEQSIKPVEINTQHSVPGTQQLGASLIELIMFIMIVSTALAGILLVMNTTTGGSANPLLRKQAIAAAYSLLEEIELQDFTSVSGVTVAVTQANRASAYHIVSDYNNFATSGIFQVTDAASASAVLANYNASVAVSGVVLNGIPAASSVQIDVTVTAPNGETITATGYRTAY